MRGITTLLAAQPVFQRRWTITTIIIGALAATMLLVSIFGMPQRQREASQLVAHTLEVLGAASTLEAQFERAVSEGRAYINSGFPDTRARADAAAAKIKDDLTALRALTADDAGQQAALDRLGVVIDARLAVLRAVMGFVAAGDQAGLKQRLQTRTGGPMTEQILAAIGSIKAEETRLLARRQAAVDSATTQTVLALLACGILAAASGLSCVTLLIVRRQERAHLAEVQRTEALLRTIQETTPGLIYAKDIQGRMLLANRPSLELIGKPWSDVEGRTDREFLDDPAQGEAIMANDRRIMDGGRTEVVEEHVGAGSEGPRTFLSTKTPLRDAGGATIGMVGVSVDITDRKRTEERLLAFNAELERGVAERTTRLAASEARQRAYFHNSPIGMIVMRVRDDSEFVLEDMNPAARVAFGFSPESAPGLTQSELWPELVARDKQRKMQACVSSRQVIEYSVTRTINGAPRVLDIALAPLFDGSSEVRFILICVHDMTQQRELELQIVEQAERQAEAAELERALFQNSPDPLFIVRVDEHASTSGFVYEAVSPAAERIFGLGVDHLVGQTLDACLPPPVRDIVVERYRRCVKARSTISFTETRDINGGQRDFEGSITPILHPASGRVVRLVGAIRDVTERNRLEAALRHSQKMQAIGRLAAGVAHDFNNILQAVISGLDLVMDESENGTPAHQFAAMALGSATRGSHLTHHLLSYARKQMLWPQDIDLATFLPDVADTLLARTLGPHVSVELSVKHKSHVLADPGELQTALLNLAINAAHAMPRGGLLRIAVQDEITAAGAWVRITVTDTGVGMDEATLAQATEPFFSTKGLAGTGLGLSMVQGFVEQSGGTVHIASKLGCGTSVELRLPAAVTVQQPSPPAAPAAQRAYAGRILLVDDVTDVLVTVGAFLQKAGFTVTRADSGERALAFLEQGGRFDALVTDYAMPGLNGGELIARGRLLQPGLAALIITGYASTGDADAAAEGVTILHKPFQRQDLIDALLRVMGQGPAGRASTSHAVRA